MIKRTIILCLILSSILNAIGQSPNIDSNNTKYSYPFYFLYDKKVKKLESYSLSELIVKSNSELRSLTSSKNPYVRCESFMILAENKDSMVFEILLKHLTDAEIVKTKGGCVISHSFVGDIFINCVRGLTSYDLNLEQESKLDSALIFFENVNLYAKNRLLKNLQPRPKYHERLREIVLKEKNSVALIPISRYRLEADIEIINKHLKHKKELYNAIYASKEFPNENLKPQLIKIYKKFWSEDLYSYSEWRILIQAMIQYEDNEIHELFSMIVSTSDGFRYQNLGSYLKIALIKYPNSFYSDLVDKINLEPYYKEQVKKEINWD